MHIITNGRDDTATTSIGIAIRIKDILEAIDENNYKTIRTHLFNDESFIDDSNSYYTSTYLLIVDGYECTGDVDKLPYKEYKDYVINKFKLYGGESGYFPLQKYEEHDTNNLYHQILLVPYDTLVETQRRGWNREGTNGYSDDLDISKLTLLSKDIHSMMKGLKITKDKYTISLVISQCGL